MNTFHSLGCALLLGALLCSAPALAEQAPARKAAGLTEIPDPELDLMRGRFIAGDNKVLWFGVSMISSWQTGSGQMLQGRLDIGFDFRDGQPVVSFSPNVVLTDEYAPMPVPSGQRSVDSAGLANVSGLVQGVQVAGDGNAASNLTSLTLRDGEIPAAAPGGASRGGVSQSAGAASASARFDGNTAGVLLAVEGHGAVEQWIRAGSMGQSIRLTSDGQSVSNQLHLDMVRESLPATAMLNQNVAQALVTTRGIGGF
ncbi:hypothetical protein [Luteimonas qiangzhengi]|uniref:hypothetical protein n=1 Tax=Luteimonas sp. MJ146 TaxID=3129240 RepID=UPI0031BB640A